MRRVAAFVVLAAGCGRFGFEDRIADDAALVDGTTPDAGTPTWTALRTYALTTCGLHDGALYCWGDNRNGELGDGTTSSRPRPQRVMLPAGTVEDFNLGQTAVCAVVDGTLLCWGGMFSATPAAIDIGVEVRKVSLGFDHACALGVDGIAYCAGTNLKGELGDGTTASRATFSNVVQDTVRYTSIDTGDDHSCAATDDGRTVCWGHNDNGTLGIGSTAPPFVDTPNEVLGPVTGPALIAGWHACGLVGTALYCWGRGLDGELGDGTATNATAPQLVPGLAAVTVYDVGGDGGELDATCAVVTEGDVMCWGRGGYGRLGTGNADPALVPTRVTGLPGPAEAVAVGTRHSCALLETGDAYCWGDNSQGQLGTGTTASSFPPVLVSAPAPE